MRAPEERRWLVIFALVVLCLTTIPYLAGYFAQNADWRFSGFVFGVEDGNSYLAKMLRGAEGDWLFRTPYTAYPQQGILAFLPYLLLGKLSAPPGQHDQLAALFQLFRWAGGWLMIYASYDFIAHFSEDVHIRRLGTLLMTLGGGLGGLALFGLESLWGERLPLEFYSPESFGFLSLFGLPHLSVARAMLLWGLLNFLAAVEQGKAGLALRAGLLWLGMSFFQPLSVVSAWAVILSYAALALLVARFHRTAISIRGLISPVLIAGLVSAPLVIYTFVLSLVDPFMQGWARQNLILSPPVGDYLLAYGAILPLAWFGFRQLYPARSAKTLLLAGWLLVFPLLAYLPYPVQRRLPEGIWTALVTLALSGLAAFSPRAQKVLRIGLLAFLLPTIFFWAGSLVTTGKASHPLFEPGDQISVYQYLARQEATDQVVLASFDTSNELPAWVAVKTITGHGPESTGAAEIQVQIAAFFQAATPDSARLDLLHSFNIEYLIYGPREQLLGDWQPDTAPFLRQVARFGETRLYQITGKMP